MDNHPNRNRSIQKEAILVLSRVLDKKDIDHKD